MRRYWRVLAVAIGVLLALLALRRLRVLAAPLLIGAILVAGWLLLGPLLTIPRFTTASGPVVRNGVAAVVACGKKRDLLPVDVVPEPRTGTWDPVQQGNCTVWYHHPPGWEQRQARQERAQREQRSVEWKAVQACGREFSISAPQARSFVRSMEIDCGIFGPLPEDARDRRPYDGPY
jgi:hypothetical protein